MAVIYLFDKNKKLKKPVKNVIEYIHREGEYTAEAQIRKKDEPAYGEFFGFMCADERFRLFLITIIDTDDETGVCTLTGIDAAVSELDGIVVERVAMQNVSALDVILSMLKGTGWESRFTAWGEYFSSEDLYYTTAWMAMQTIGLLSKVRFDPVYEFTDGAITDKYVWVTERTNPFRGAIYTRKKGARNIQLTKEGRPYGRVYPIGKVVGDEEPPEQLTIAEAVWSVANGNPTDKPAGQTWIAIPGATTTDAYVFEDKAETDPMRLMEKGFSDLRERQKWHASGTANITDMSFARGYDFRPPTMWETVAIRTEDGETIETVITNIERYGVHTELTKIVVGKEETLEDQIVKMERETVDAIKKSGGAGAGAGKAKRMILEAEELIQMNTERIEGNAKEILLRATSLRVDQLENETLVKFEETRLEMDETRGALSTVRQDVDNINNAVAGAVGEIETLAGEVAMRAYNYTVDEMGKRVRDNEAYIKALPGLLEAKADLILLDGYVKANQLEAQKARIDNIIAGNVVFQSLHVNHDLSAQTAQFTNVSLINSDCKWKSVSMGDLASAKLLGQALSNDLNLEHSHTIEYDEATGKFTLAGVSSSGGSFSIADTQFYKDGVKAAADLVTLTARGWVGKQNTVNGSNGKTATVLLPNMTIKNVDAWNSLHKTYARLGYRDANGSEVEAGYVEVNAGEVYLEGKEDGMNEAGADYATGYEAGKLDWNPAVLRRETYSTNDKTVFVRALNAADVSLLWANVDVSEIYDEAVSDGAGRVTLSQSGWVNGANTVTATNQRTETVIFPSFRASVDDWNSLHKTVVRMNYTNANGNTQQAAMTEVDASSVYLLGKSDGMAEANGGYEQGKTDWMPVEIRREGYEPETYTVHVKAYNAAGVPLISEHVNVYEMYALGQAEVSLSQDGWVGRQNTVRASSGQRTTVIMPNVYIREDEWLTNNTKPVYVVMTDKNGESISLDSAVIDGSAIYTKGRNSVTLSQSGWVGKQNAVKASNGQQVTVLLPAFTGSVDDWNSLHRTNARVRYTDANGSTVEAAYVTVDASSVYDDGVQTGYISGKADYQPSRIERATFDAGQKTVTVRALNAAGAPVLGGQVISAAEIYDRGQTDWAPTDLQTVEYDSDRKQLTVRAINAAGVPVISEALDVWDVYENGYHRGWNDVTVSPAGWVGKQNTVRASNGKQTTVLLPAFTGSVDGWNSLNKTYARFGYKDSGGNAVEAGWVEVDASEIFSAGEETVKGNITIGIDTPSSITHLGDNVYQMKVRIWARYNGETVASTTAYPTKGLYR